METKFNFKSQICTTREQSERLLALGLKKETADMHWYKPVEFEHDYWFMGIGPEWCGVRDIPAWSLHRLIEMALRYVLTRNKKGELKLFRWTPKYNERLDMWYEEHLEDGYGNICDTEYPEVTFENSPVIKK